MEQLGKIYTKTGDKGYTSTADGRPSFKSSAIIHALGDIDELNAHVGHLIELCKDEVPRQTILSRIQMDLFNIGGRVTLKPYVNKNAPDFGDDRIESLEKYIDAHTPYQEPIDGFILPRGSKAITQAHICRTVARRAERSLCAAGVNGKEVELKYLNRLSDFFFVFVRFLHGSNEIDEFIWRSE